MPDKSKITQIKSDRLGIPYPVIPTSTFLRDEARGELSKHHEFFPGNDEIFSTVGGMAVRASRILKVQKSQHNKGNLALHGRRLAPPIVPKTRADQIKVCVFGVAGYVPEIGMDLSSAETVERKLSPEEREILLTSDDNAGNATRRRYLTVGETTIGAFFQNAVYEADIVDDPDSLETAERLAGAVNGTALKLGHEIIEKTAGILTAELEDDYQTARLKGLLSPSAPATAQEVFLKVFGSNASRENLIISIKEKIVASLGQTACQAYTLKAA